MAAALPLPPASRRTASLFWCGSLLLAAGILRGAPAAAPAASRSASCLECHDDKTLTMKKAGRLVSLFVDPAALSHSVHSSLDCTDCHDGFDGDSIPHKRPLTPVDCSSCHDDIGRKHVFHPRLAKAPFPAGPDTNCSACHGTHDIAPVKSAAFPFSPARETAACGRCHEPERDAFLASAHGRAAAQGVRDAPDCLTCHRKAVASPAAGQTRLGLKLDQVALCESCHLQKPAVADKTLLGRHFVASFERSVHGAALARGEASAANCVDCHGSHQMNQAMAAGSRVSKQHIPETCAKCHVREAADYAASVHARSLQQGNVDSPVCTTCHGEHDIRAHTDPTSPVYSKNVAQQVCAGCHASVRLTQKYGLASDVFQTFSDSYHGLAERGGAVVVVNCASCHGAHAIKSPLDPTSPVNKRNLAATCGQCHPGANTRFGIGQVHSSADQRGRSPILYWIANLYVILIVLVVGGMGLHNLLDFLKKVRRELAVQKGLIREEPAPHRLYLRMTLNQRLQHAGLAVSFALLVITGFMLRYPDAWWVVAIRHVSSQAFVLRGLIHRLAGIALIAAGVWHIGYLALTAEGRQLFRDLLPRKRDLTDPWAILRYNLGFSQEKPKFGRFSYIEKSEYWALVWGTVLMGVTGVILWFENTSMGLFTKLGFDISRTIHFYEAILATLAIIAWHFYFVIFNPDVYPMNLAWLTGRVSEHEMRADHPLELERLQQAAPDAAPPSPPPAAPGPDAAPPPS
jgi:cytochrome b subunit of formate dehydrogenase